MATFWRKLEFMNCIKYGMEDQRMRFYDNSINANLMLTGLVLEGQDAAKHQSECKKDQAMQILDEGWKKARIIVNNKMKTNFQIKY